MKKNMKKYITEGFKKVTEAFSLGMKPNREAAKGVIEREVVSELIDDYTLEYSTRLSESSELKEVQKRIEEEISTLNACMSNLELLGNARDSIINGIKEAVEEKCKKDSTASPVHSTFTLKNNSGSDMLVGDPLTGQIITLKPGEVHVLGNIRT